ncbi:hypothetical protein Goshw_018736 [Gossypium schwendimanii]|uniref:Uncharacterized protein n=1 Tax=Gossypium schwendimanii TaxID=34291 RepID=A0A7J9M508_GOSSC|nr:hypothetical protein [Gossypium schwendimanii]
MPIYRIVMIFPWMMLIGITSLFFKAHPGARYLAKILSGIGFVCTLMVHLIMTRVLLQQGELCGIVMGSGYLGLTNTCGVLQFLTRSCGLSWMG